MKLVSPFLSSLLHAVVPGMEDTHGSKAVGLMVRVLCRRISLSSGSVRKELTSFLLA